ncbi:MAG: dihydroorotase [Alphaproteobacteria bacterium]
MEKLDLIAPDDMHCHLRDGVLLDHVIFETARQFKRAVIMPNLTQPVIDGARAAAYQQRIMSSLEQQAMIHNRSDIAAEFTPLMTLYVTDQSDPQEYKRAFLAGEAIAAKLYPANATTNSAHGVRDIFALKPLFSMMSDLGMPLLIHGEVTASEIDIFDREAVFIEQVLKPLRAEFPALRMVLEHITTAQAADFIGDSDDPNLAATITPHHMMLNRNALFQGGIRPDHYCLPILKRETHRAAILAAATSGHPRIFAGTDSAPHTKSAKLQPCGCAGIYNAFEAIGLYAELFENENCLHHLEGFTSINGANFYGLPQNKARITLVKQPIAVPEYFEIEQPSGKDYITPLRAGKTIAWRHA